jgi:hypothetical protein
MTKKTMRECNNCSELFDEDITEFGAVIDVFFAGNQKCTVSKIVPKWKEFKKGGSDFCSIRCLTDWITEYLAGEND